MDIVGDVYEFLIARFAAQAGKKAGEFYTPKEVSVTLAKLVNPQPGARICDPTCGSGSLLIKAAAEVGTRDFSLFGQEMNGSTWARHSHHRPTRCFPALTEPANPGQASNPCHLCRSQ
jgi:type I restriction enzyme M protein